MKKTQQRKRSSAFKITKLRIAMIGTLAAIVAGVTVFSYNSMVPVNGSVPVFGLPANHFIKATHSGNSGYVFVSVSSGAVKGIRNSGGGGGHVNPTYVFGKGQLQSVHFINEDYDTNSRHNFNIDAFNVHTRDLAPSESQTLTFLADKTGTFQYYCSIHPEMKGDIIVE